MLRSIAASLVLSKPQKLHRSFIKHSHWRVCFLVYVKKLACFYEPQFGRISLNISLSDSVLDTKKSSGKSVDFDLPISCNYRRMWTLMVFKLWWFDIFDSLSLVQPIRLFVPFPVGFWLAYWSVLYENIYGGSYGGKFLKKLVVLLPGVSHLHVIKPLMLTTELKTKINQILLFAVANLRFMRV